MGTIQTTPLIESGPLVAVFDEKVKLYLVARVAATLAATGVGLVLLPFWLVLGPIWAGRYFKSMVARLTDRSLEYSHGVWFRQETSVPLDKVQDLSLLHGPVLNALGLSTLRIDTAGSSTPGAAAASLEGVVDAARFRDEVLRRRDALQGRGEPAQAAAPAEVGSAAELREIRDSLRRIEALLERGLAER